MAGPAATGVEIAVVGGGPAGLSAALMLAATGAEVALIAPAAPEDQRTTALLSGSVEALDAAGGWAEVAPHAAPLKTMRLVDASRRLIRAPEIAFHARELGLEAFGWNVANGPLVASLSRALMASGRIHRIESVVSGYQFGDGPAVITTVDGRTVTARLVVAADGRSSPARQAAGIKVKTWTYPQTALVLNVEHLQPHHDTSTEFHTETGPFTLVPLGPGRSSVVCVVRPGEAERLAALADGDLSADLERRSHSILGRLAVTGAKQTWPMSGLSADRMGAGRVVLVGESGHAFPPIAAQGLNLGIRDIAALASLVRRIRRAGGDVGSADTVSRYVSARRPDVTSRTVGVDLLNRSLLTDFLPVQAARAVTLQLARDVPPIRRLMMRAGLRPTLFQSA